MKAALYSCLGYSSSKADIIVKQEQEHKLKASEVLYKINMMRTIVEIIKFDVEYSIDLKNGFIERFVINKQIDYPKHLKFYKKMIQSVYRKNITSSMNILDDWTHKYIKFFIFDVVTSVPNGLKLNEFTKLFLDNTNRKLKKFMKEIKMLL